MFTSTRGNFFGTTSDIFGFGALKNVRKWFHQNFPTGFWLSQKQVYCFCTPLLCWFLLSNIKSNYLYNPLLRKWNLIWVIWIWGYCEFACHRFTLFKWKFFYAKTCNIFIIMILVSYLDIKKELIAYVSVFLVNY